MSLRVEGSHQMTIDAPAARVWEINGTRFAEIGSWSRNVLQSAPTSGTPLQGAPSAGRACKVVGFGDVYETLTEFDPLNRRLALTVDEGLPFFVYKSVFESRVVPLDANSCRFEVSQWMEISVFPGALMMPLLNRKLNAAVESILGDLKFYAENGKPHPEKKPLRQAS